MTFAAFVTLVILVTFVTTPDPSTEIPSVREGDGIESSWNALEKEGQIPCLPAGS